MIKQIIIAVSVLMFATEIANAHGGKVSGVATESETGRPIPYVSVYIDGTNLGKAADSVGRFTLTHVPTGTQVVIVSAVGFKTRRLKVTVAEGEAVELATTLQPTQVDAGSMVVTGTRTPRYVKDVPVFTEVVSKASISDKAAHNIFEALEGESGVCVEQQCQSCNFTILRMQGLGADHTQILLDGQPVYSGLAGVYGLQQMSTADVDQIEIVKGAGSALYGSNAVAGAINIVSSVPRKTEGRVGIEIGEHGTNRYEVSASTRKDKLGIFLFAQQSEQDELDETGDISAPGGINEPDGWTDRVQAIAKTSGFNLFLDDLLAADQLVVRGRILNEIRRGGSLTDDLFENPFTPGTEHINTDRHSGQLEYKLWLPGGSELNASVSFTGHERDATNDTFLGDYEEAKGETPPVDLLRPYIANEKLLSVNLNFLQPIKSRHRLLAGVQFSRNNLEERGMYLDPTSQEPYMSTSQKNGDEIGLYLQDEFKATDKLEFVAGLRYDYHSSEDEFRGSGDILPDGLEPLEYKESTVNPRFSVKYAATNDLILRGSIGSGFRVPYGFSEDLHLCSGSPRVYKGGNLKPEKSFSYSMTVDYTKQSLSTSLNVYRTELKDAIAFAEADAQVADLGYTYQWQNVADAFVMGAEFNASYALTRDLAMGFRFEIFEGMYDNPREDWLGTPYEEASRNISRYPKTSGGLKLNYSPSGWSFVINADYKGKMYIDLTEPVDPADVKIHETESFVIFNAKLSKNIFNRYNVYLGVRNLTGYTQEEKHIDDAAFMYAPVYGRIIYSGVQVSL